MKPKISLRSKKLIMPNIKKENYLIHDTKYLIKPYALCLADLEKYPPSLSHLTVTLFHYLTLTIINESKHFNFSKSWYLISHLTLIKKVPIITSLINCVLWSKLLEQNKKVNAE
jgi:hypothetical protein